MNSWPTLKEWIQFGGIVALEVLIVFAVAKIAALRIHSAPWRRALWQMALVAMLIIVVGELSGVRGLMRLPEKTVIPPQRKLIVTLKEPDVAFPLLPTPVPKIKVAIPSQTRWEQPLAWPAWVWLAGTALAMCRGLLAQITAQAFRLTSRRIDNAELVGRMERVRGAFRIRRRVRLLESARAVAPFTFGIWKPVIMLPHGFAETFTPDQQEVALAHELAHVAGFDSAWRSGSDFVCALLWWHPLAWQTKRELSQASEFVADESSLLIADGPNRLAECLVACAKELRPLALNTWLGMDGGGFRSSLGRRVARLMQLRPDDSIVRHVPWYARLVVPILSIALLWAGIVAISKPNQPRVSAWRASILGSAFAAASDVKPSANTTALNTNVVREVNSKTDAPPVTSKARQEIFMKLRETRLKEWGPIDNLPLSEVVRSLADEMHRRDPEGKGLNFMVSGNSPSAHAAVLDAAGLPVAPSAEADLNATPVRLGSMLRDVTFEDALNVLIRVAARPIHYSIEDYGVVIGPGSESSQPLHTRFFKIDPNTFAQGLSSVTAFDFNGGRKKIVSGDVTQTNLVPALQSFFKTAGVDLSGPAKTIFFNDRVGVLMVRATLSDLDTVEKAMQLLNMNPPQLTIRVKVFEVDKHKNRSALDYFLGTLVTNDTVTAPAGSREYRPERKGADSDAIPADRLTSGLRAKSAIPAPTVMGILNDEQFRKMVHAMEQRGMSDMLSAPEVTTMSGRQAQIKVVDVQYIVTDLDYDTQVSAKPAAGAATAGGETNSLIVPIAEPFEIGPVLDVVPYVMPDGMTIQMTVLPTVREFLGYDDPGEFVAEVHLGSTNSTNVVKSPVPLPRFRLRQVSTTAVVWDGQTLMLSAGTSREQVRTRDASGKLTTTFKDKELFYFITPRLIDPAGNPLHSETELRNVQTTVPAQPGNKTSPRPR